MAPLEYDDIVAISYITAMVAARLQKITRTYCSPETYTKKCLSLMQHNWSLGIISILFNIKNMEGNRLYKPLEIKIEINESLQTVFSDNSSLDTMTAPTSKSNGAGRKHVNSKDISKALKVLESEVGLTKLTTKEEVKKIKGRQKIEFLGRPHFYKLPPTVEDVKRIINNPEAVAIIFRSLRKLGLYCHLKFLLKASFHAIRDSNVEESVYTLSRTAIDRMRELGVTLDQPGWDSYRKALISASDDQIELIADKIADLAANCPEHCSFILLMAILSPV